MRKSIYFAFALLLFAMSCSDSEKFQIKRGQVGHLTPKTTIHDLREIFKNDSIVTNLSEGSMGDSYFQDDDEYLIYEKGGKHLLTVVPKEQLDSSSTIKSIQIFDKRFETETGINISSNFLDIDANTNIDKVESSFSSATLFIDDLNATISIDKEELGLKAFSSLKVTKEQIPDLAKIKAFTIWFN
jgi:hypothetical protein